MADAVFVLAMLKRKLVDLANCEETRYKSYTAEEILRAIAGFEAYTVLGEGKETE